MPDRRARLHAWTRGEIKAAALRQLAAGGVDGLSLNAIAKELGMTGPALYRYVSSRDELLADLVVDAYDDLADALVEAAREHADAPAEARLRALADAYRAWATAAPHRYRLVFSTPHGSGAVAAERTIPAAQRSMEAILDAIDALAETRLPAPPPALRAQLAEWTRRVGGRRHAAPVLLRGIVFWTRLHGLISLELEGHLASMQVDATLLYQGEVAELGGRR